jgi:hypothetical protein
VSKSHFQQYGCFPAKNTGNVFLTAEEEELYFRAAGSEAMEQHSDPRLLADVAQIIFDCGLRPEECFRLKPENVTEGKIEATSGRLTMRDGGFR